MPSSIRTNFGSLDYRDFGGGYNSRDQDINVADNELTGGQNVDISPDKSLKKRKGHTLYGNLIGTTTGILGLIPHTPQGGTAELLAVYHTGVYRYVAGTWTALTSVTMTTNLKADSAYFPLTSKTYITNGTDAVVKYTSGTSGDQSDTSFKKGKYIVHFKNRLLVANVASQTDYVWYTDLGVDTFSANNYFRVEGEITGMEVLFDKVLIFTKRKIYKLQSFGFDGVAAGPEAVIPLKTDFGAIYDRTIKKVDNLVYFIGQSSDGISSPYITDGYTVSNKFAEKVKSDFDSLSATYLTNACATDWGQYYRCSVTPTGETTNTKEYLWDTVSRRWLPPYTNRHGGFSCYATWEVSGELDVYAGTQGMGQVYKLNQVDYDEVAEESYTTTGSYDGPIDANPAKRVAQSFKLSDYTINDTVPINSVWLLLKKNAGTTTGLTVRIETNNNGTPSGTLADAQATTTIDAITSTSYAYVKATFSNVTLTGNTTYWIVVKHTTEGSGDSQYYWGGNGSSPTYSNGNLATYLDSTSGTLTFTPDAHPESTSVDGVVARQVYSASESFSTIRTATTGGKSDTGLTMIPNIIADTTTDKYVEMARGIVLFDTSSLPDDAVITGATIQVYVQAKHNDFAQSLGVTAVTPTANTSLVAADYDIAKFGSTRFATDVNIDSLTENAYNTITLNNDGIAAITDTGVSKFALRLSGDIDNTAPTWASGETSYAILHTSDNTNKPRLVVTYTSAGGSAIWTAVAGTDQNFLMYTQGAIDGYGETKAFYFAPQGQKAHLRDLFVTADASSTSYNLKVGVNGGTFAGYSEADLDLGAAGSTWGSFTWGSGTWGGQNRIEERIRFRSSRVRTAKFRFRNANANEPFTVYGFRTRHEVLPKLK